MNCRSAESLYSAFLEEELSQEERRSMEAHLMACRRCSVAVKELRHTLTLMSALPSVATSPHFEEEIFDRIRSGEALRPTLIEWLGGFFTPERLRPVFLGGAAVCAVWIAVIVTHPANFLPGNGTVANREAQAPNATSTDAGSLDASESVAMTPDAESASEPSAPVFGPRAAFASEPSNVVSGPTAGRAATGDQWADRKSPATSNGSDSALTPGSPFQDEYILDQFYLERGSERGTQSIVPVSGDATDDVYITF